MCAPASHGWRAASLVLLLLLGVRAAHAQPAYLQAGDVRVYYWPAQQRLAQSITQTAAVQRFRGLPDSILAVGIPIHLYIAPDPQRFDSLTGGRAPEWGAGVAMPLQNRIVVPGYVSERTGVHELRPVVRHELAHVALQRHLGTARVPRWFTEGYATWVSGQFDDREGWMLRVAFMTGAAPPLDSLVLEWPELAPDARMAYALSASAVRYLHSLGSGETFTRFLDHWRDTGSLEQSLRTVYIVSSAQFERLWRAHVKRTYGWTQIVAQSMFVWLVLTLIVLVLFVVRRRRDRRRMRSLRESELPDSPAYWAATTIESEDVTAEAGEPEGLTPEAAAEAAEADGEPEAGTGEDGDGTRRGV